MANNSELIFNLGGLRIDENRRIANIKFEKEDFQRFLIGPGAPPNSKVSIENCSFVSCKVNGEFRIAEGTILKNVIFDSMHSPDAMIISSQASLESVIVKGGSSCAGLWVKPSQFSDPEKRRSYEAWASSLDSAGSYALDFSEFHAKEVEVLGLPIDKLRWDPARHIVLRRERLQADTWKTLNFPMSSFWRLCFRRLETFGVSSGVYSLPLEGEKKFAQTMSEMQILIGSGILD